MPINAEVALSAGAIDFGSTTPDNFASLFKAGNFYRIANDFLGQDSAVLGIEPEQNLLVNPQGTTDPLREWIIKYTTGHILEHVAVRAPPTPQYANIRLEIPSPAVILGPVEQPFDFHPGPPTIGPGMPHVWIEDKKSGLVWELQTELIDPKFPPITLKPRQEGNLKQLWVFFGPGS